MFRYSRFRNILHILVTLSLVGEILLSSFMHVGAQNRWQSESTIQPTSITTNIVSDSGNTDPTPSNPSDLLETARETLDRQQNYVEPVPVALDAVLPPGTIRAAVNNSPLSTSSSIYLPLVFAGGEQLPEELALHPDTWMSATDGWSIYESYGVAIRYPANYSVTQRALGPIPNSVNEFMITDNQLEVKLIIEPLEQVVSLATIESPSVIEAYQQSGYIVEEVTL